VGDFPFIHVATPVEVQRADRGPVREGEGGPIKQFTG
jgi:hypothetical protein